MLVQAIFAAAQRGCEVLIYKRTHSGDPDEAGQFGINDCMGQVRRWNFDAVIGVGGVGAKARSLGIDERVNWIGIGPHKEVVAGTARSSRDLRSFCSIRREGAKVRASGAYARPANLFKKCASADEWTEPDGRARGSGHPAAGQERSAVAVPSRECRLDAQGVFAEKARASEQGDQGLLALISSGHCRSNQSRNRRGWASVGSTALR